MTPLRSLFVEIKSFDNSLHIIVPTGNTVIVEKMGTIVLNSNIKL